jgi:hypothetical protein
LDAAGLKSVTAGGLVREDVLDKIYGADERGTPFLDAVGGGSFDNNYSEWFEEDLLSADATNAYSSGTDYAPATTATGHRKGNHAQISRRGVNVTDRAQEIQKVGRSDEVGYETARKIQNLRYDKEAISLSNQASVADNPGSTVGKTAGLGAILKTNTLFGANGANGGFNTSTKVVDTITAGDTRVLAWSYVSSMIEACYLLGSKPTLLLGRPELTKRVGQYLIATGKAVSPVANISGTQPETVVANMYVDSFKTDFGYIMQLVPDLHQQTYLAHDGSTPTSVLFGIDPNYIEVPSLYGVRVKPLASNGDYVRKLIQEDWMTRVTLERAHFAIRDITPTGTVTD